MYINKKVTLDWIKDDYCAASIDEIEQVLAILHKHDPSLTVESYLIFTDGNCNVDEFINLFGVDSNYKYDAIYNAVCKEIGRELEKEIDFAARWDDLLTAMLLDKPGRVFGGVPAKPYVKAYKRYKAEQL